MFSTSCSVTPPSYLGLLDLTKGALCYVASGLGCFSRVSRYLWVSHRRRRVVNKS